MGSALVCSDNRGRGGDLDPIRCNSSYQPRQQHTMNGSCDKEKIYSNGDPGSSSHSSEASASPDPCKVSTIEDSPAYKIMLFLQKLERGETPPVSELRKTLCNAARALTTCPDNTDTDDSGEGKLETVGDLQVREWLSSTFTRTESAYEAHHVAMTPIGRFKAAANTIIIGHYFGSIRRESLSRSSLHYSEELVQYFKDHLDRWEFDMFQADTLSGHQPLRHVGYELFRKHELFDKFEIPPSSLDSFLSEVEKGYSSYGNPYHSACHGADVAQTVHYLIHATGLKDVLSDLEVMSMLLAALIHDVDHPGTSNAFQIAQQSEYALLYNDRSVLENHHLHYSFKILQQNECNFLCNLSAEDYKLLRGLVVDMVLSTDMSFHFDQIKHMKHLTTAPHAMKTQLLLTDRSKVLNLLLHTADISHPGKPWQLHHRWSTRLAEEFYRQGDKEKQLGRSPSPMCDRDNGNLPESQLGFIDFIVSPSFQMCGDVIELIQDTPHLSLPQQSHDHTMESDTESHDTESPGMYRIWDKYLLDNKEKWRQDGDLNNGWSHTGDGDAVSEEPKTVELAQGHSKKIHIIASIETCHTHNQLPPLQQQQQNHTMKLRANESSEITII